VDRDARLRRARELCGTAAFDEADSLLAALLKEYPRDADALLLRGMIAGQSRDSEAALRWFEQARDIDPRRAEVWNGIGLVRRQLGRLDEAVQAYERALALDPKDVEAHVNLAVALKGQRQFERAISHLERAIRLQPRLVPAFLNLGNCHFDRRDLDKAGAAYVQCLKLDPGASAAAIGLSKVFREQKRFDLAERTLRTAASRRPDDAEITATLGALLHDVGQEAEARDTLDRSLALDPQNAAALYYAGNIRHDFGRWDEAETFYRRALAVAPDHADALINMADCLAELGRKPEAQQALDAARQAHGNDPDVRYACGITALTHGDFAKGWPDIRSQVKTAKRKAMRFPHLPKLDSLDFAGRRAVIWGDQGIGDEIIFASFLLSLGSHASEMVCELDRRLVPLFSRGLPEFTFIERSFQPPPPSPTDEKAWLRTWRAASLDRRLAGVTHQLPLPDLGGWLRPDFSSFPRHAGYLKADGARVAEFRRAMKTGNEALIGVSWRSQNKSLGRHKSIALRQMLDALPSSRLRFVNLQYGEVDEEIAAAREATGRSVEIVPGLDCYNDIDGLAALTMACDAVVTVSNVTAHIAGGLGQKVGLFCPVGLGRLCYWFDSGRASPWYPSMQIFRQQRDASWTEAFADCAAWLSDLSP